MMHRLQQSEIHTSEMCSHIPTRRTMAGIPIDPHITEPYE
jgi:hypothetical protein